MKFNIFNEQEIKTTVEAEGNRIGFYRIIDKKIYAVEHILQSDKYKEFVETVEEYCVMSNREFKVFAKSEKYKRSVS